MQPQHRKFWIINLVVLITLGGFAIVARQGGCRGSGSQNADKQTKENEKKNKIRKPDFLSRAPTVLPGHFAQTINGWRSTDEDNEADIPSALGSLRDPAFRTNRIKQGHWYGVHLPIVPNHFDIEGELHTFSVLPTGKPAAIPGTDHQLTCTRPVSLARGQWKNLQSSVFVPVRETSNIGSVNINYLLSRPNVTLNPFETMQPVLPMEPWQHHFVVLSDRPDTWSYLKLTDSFQLRGQSGDGGRIPPFYLLVTSQPDDPIPLASNPLQWTTTAYLLWDNIEPERLDLDQQNALIDWLHQGGQLIVSGPDCLDRLQSGFLSAWLPGDFDGTTNLTSDDVKELNQYWSIPNPRRPTEKRQLKISAAVPLLGVRMELRDEGRFVDGTGSLVAERQVGRGRIAVTAFSLTSSVVTAWPSFQGFLNGALLRKPARSFKTDRNFNESFHWTDRSASPFDPLLGSTLRFISRDLGSSGTPRRPAPTNSLDEPFSDNNSLAYATAIPVDAEAGMEADVDVETQQDTDPRIDVWRYGGYKSSTYGGTSAWNDFNGIASSARVTILQSAGIAPPSADFVFKMLFGYLVVLVPLNWIVFRVLGRVEWAWLAAPLIAIAGAVSVARLASLDIGFVRSNTELGLLELHADHSRGHLTRYSALYTSLSTLYKASLDNPTSLALPFPAGTGRVDSDANVTLKNVNLRRTVTNQLEDYFVQSNSTGLLHTESMLDLEGALSLEPGSLDDPATPEVLTNSTSLNLLSAGVVRRSTDGEYYEVAWIGELMSQQSIDLDFQSVPYEQLYANWQSDARIAEDATAASDEPDVTSTSGVSTGRMFEVVAKQLQLAAGETRMLAVCEQALGRTKLTPTSTRNFRQTLVVAHLKPGLLPPARRDANVRPVRRGMLNLDYEEEMLELEKQFESDPDITND